MDPASLDARINSFLRRKYAEFPDLAISGRSEGQRTAKYASGLRASGQILMAR